MTSDLRSPEEIEAGRRLFTRAWTWLVWAALLFFFALRHPTIFDDMPMDRNRVLLGLAALAIFLLTFTVIPIR